MEENVSPVDHAGRGTHGSHDVIDEGAINRVISLRNINEDVGTRPPVIP